MTDILELEIGGHYKELRPSERKVADYLLRCDEELEDMTLTELAERAKVSQPTVLRFARGLGYEGFRELKTTILEDRMRKKMEMERISPLYGFPVTRDDMLTDVPSKVIGTAIHIMQETLKSISLKEYMKAIEFITCAENIVVYGVENSLCTVSDLMTKFLYLGLNCRNYNDYYLQSVSAGNLSEKDVAIGISYSGNSRNTVEVIRMAKKAGAKTIVITNFEEAPICKYADVIICTSTEQFLYGDAIFSRTSQLAIVDMLYMGVLLSDYDKYTEKMDKSSKVICSQPYEIR
ncbi:MAG: MurR/RpiR family transcriptional regulator [Roseburia sp.]